MAENAAFCRSAQLESFRTWSRVYDEQPNPMLSLEDRILRNLLPDLTGLDVLDLGCGTGRWLVQVTKRNPQSLIGVDISPEMLSVARNKLGPRVRLICSDATHTPLPDNSVDVILASFLAAHIDNIGELAAEASRLLREGGHLFVSDLHPSTVHTLGWNRAFRQAEQTIPLRVTTWSLESLRAAFENKGLDIAATVEPVFGGPERHLLIRSGKAAVAASAAGRPAIILLHVRRRRPQSINRPWNSGRITSIIGAGVALTAADLVHSSLEFEHSRICGLGTSSNDSPAAKAQVDSTGYTLLPGLINSHDHLDFGLFPRLGNGPYANFTDWFEDIHRNKSDSIEQYRAVPKQTRIWWGALRNLLSGVTTVCHHNPLSADMMAEDFPIRVLSQFGWAHSVALERSFAVRHQRTPHDQPFIIHAGEGTDDKSAAELHELERSGALDNRTVIIHGLASSPEFIRSMNRRGSALIWCPSSNSFLFGRTHTRHSLHSFDRVAIGSDSSLTSKGDLLDEIRFARRHVGVSPVRLYDQVTSDSAGILRLKNGSGHIRIGGPADLIAIRNSDLCPSDALVQMSFRDVHLVLKGARVQLVSPELMERIPGHLLTGLRPIEVDGIVRWVRAPIGRMFSEAVTFLGCDVRLSGRRVRHVCTDWL